MQNVRFITLALASMAALAACSDNPAGPAPDAITVKPVTASAVTTQTVCSDATTATTNGNTFNIFTDVSANTSGGKNNVWAAPIGASAWVGPTVGFTSTVAGAQADQDWLRDDIQTFNTTFNIPPGATGISLTGAVQADNGVVVSLNAGAPLLSEGTGPYPASEPDNSTFPNFETLGGAPFSTSTGFVTGDNHVTFALHNDDYPNFGQFDATAQPSTGNPNGLDFCYTVSYTPFVPPPSGGQGCTLGYWKNHTNKWTTYTSGQSFASVFGATHNPYGTKSLLAVLQTGGGGIINLGRQTVAALLNASSGISFGEDVAHVISDFQAVYPGTGTASQIAAAQNALASKFEGMTDAVAPNVCPLN